MLLFCPRWTCGNLLSKTLHTQPLQQVEFHLKGDDSKVGRRIAKLKEKKARAKRKARLKHQGPRVTEKSSASQGETRLPPTDASSAGDWIEREDDEYGDRGQAAN